MEPIEQIADQYGGALLRIAASYEADPSLREDLLQEMLLAVYRALPSLQDPQRMRAYIFRIAHNRGVSHVVKQSRQRKRELAVADFHIDSHADRHLYRHISNRAEINDQASSGPEQHLYVTDRSRRLFSAIRQLKLPYRQVMTLILEDLSYEEIADALGISVSNVGVRINRAKARLKVLLNDA